MNTVIQVVSWLLIGGGVFFFFTGAFGLVRFPDIYSRLHAVTKADNTGLGLLAAGLVLAAGDWHTALVILLIWLLVMASGATSCQLLARYQNEREKEQGGDDG